MEPSRHHTKIVITLVVFVVVGALAGIFAAHKERKTTAEPASMPRVAANVTKLNPGQRKDVDAAIAASGVGYVQSKVYSTKITPNTQPVQLVNITGCTPEPDIATARKSGKLTFINQDKRHHILMFDKDHFYAVNGNSSTTIKLDFVKLGMSSYVCDSAEKGSAGLLNIIP